MNLLAIDTTTAHSSVALGYQNRLLSRRQDTIKQHARLLLPMIDELLKEADVSLNQLDGIVFGRGPGSFTGLRIACSAAKALAFAHDLPVYPVSSLASIAQDAFKMANHIADETTVLAMIDARMQQVYWAYFSSSNCFASTEHVSDADKVTISQNPVVLAGVGLEPYRPALSEALQHNIVQTYSLFPDAQTLIQLVQSVSAQDALPVYVRNQVTQGAKRG